MSSRVIFISDLHISNAQKWSWFDYGTGGDETRLLKLLDYLLKHPDPELDIVFLGDVFDNWVCPPDTQPPTWEEIFQSAKNQPILTALRRLAAMTPVYYVNGNHDFQLTQALLEGAVPGIRYLENCYRNTNLQVHGEHGHRYGMFNAPDPVNDPTNHLPLGYYTSRLAASMQLKNSIEVIQNIFNSCLCNILDSSVDTVEAFFVDDPAHSRLSDLIIDSVATTAGLGDSTPVVMPRGEKITLAEVKNRYRSLFRQYRARVASPQQVLKHIGADTIQLKPYVQTIRSAQGPWIVVLGHSHVYGCDLDPKIFYGFDSIYLNGGTWLGKDYSTYAEVLRENGGQKIIARVHRYDQQGKDKIIREKALNK